MFIGYVQIATATIAEHYNDSVNHCLGRNLHNFTVKKRSQFKTFQLVRIERDS